MNNSDSLIINLCPTGLLPTKEQNPHVPISPTEIITDVLACYEQGITCIHLHVRDEKGAPTYKKELFAECIVGIREYAPELIIGVSCSGRDVPDFEKRSEVLDLKGDLRPDMASLTLGSLNFHNNASMNSPQMIQDLAMKMKDNGIKPELEVFDVGMINYAKYLIDKGILEPPFYFNLILGNISSAQADLRHLSAMISDLPEGAYWSLAGFGLNQLRMNSISIAMGGGVRVGLEDNLWLDDNKHKPASNLELLKRIVLTASIHDRDIMMPSDFRKLLEIP